MALLNREALLKRQELATKQVFLEGEDYVYVRAMTGYERDLFEQSILKEKVDEKGEFVGYDRVSENFRSKLAVLTICDEKGDLILNPDDYQQFSKSISIINLEKIIAEASELNKITPKDKEELLKKSKADQDGNSNSGSVVS